MRIPITFNSSIATNDQRDTGSTSSPVTDSARKLVESDSEQAFTSDSINSHAARERPSKPTPPIRWLELVGFGDDGERYLVYAADLNNMDSCRKFEAVLDYCFDGRSGKPGSPQDELPELLDFSIDLEKMLANGEPLQQDRPKGILLNFELPPHMNTESGANSRGPARIIDFRRSQFLNRRH